MQDYNKGSPTDQIHNQTYMQIMQKITEATEIVVVARIKSKELMKP